MVLAANPAWWGRSGQGIGNLTEVQFTVIQSDATRLAALATGEADFVIDPPFQDVARLKQDKRLKFTEISDIGTQYLGFDQAREELQFADVKGRNPFKDVRVRRAVYQAIARPHRQRAATVAVRPAAASALSQNPRLGDAPWHQRSAVAQ